MLNVETEHNTVVLYGTDMCHLCEEAAAIVEQVCNERVLHWKETDIIDDDRLYERFKTVIPVLKNKKGQLLHWPFDVSSVRNFLL